MEHDKSTTGVFTTEAGAAEALRDLQVKGFSPSDVSVLMSDHVGEDFKVEANSKLPEGAAIGGASGGILGAAIGGLTAVGSIASGGAGILVAGPAVAALAGAGAGSATGGIIGGLVGAGIPEHEATTFAESLSDGTVLVAVSCRDSDRRDAADAVLKNQGATEVSHR